MNIDKLKEPFSPNDIEWRMQSSGIKNGKPWGKCLAYLTNRAVLDRLDEVFGLTGWKDRFEITQLGVVCTISVKVNDEWISKSDGAQFTDIESFKGGISDAEKRAAVKFGIGRYLYHLSTNWAEFKEDGRYNAKIKDGKDDKHGKWFKWNPPQLPKWALPDNEPISEKDKLISEIIKLTEDNKTIVGATAINYNTSANLQKFNVSMLDTILTKLNKHIEEAKTNLTIQTVEKAFDGEVVKDKELF